jgi:hypothetical protein
MEHLTRSVQAVIDYIQIERATLSHAALCIFFL